MATQKQLVDKILEVKAELAKKCPDFAIDCPRHLLEGHFVAGEFVGGLSIASLESVLRCVEEDIEVYNGRVSSGRRPGTIKCRDCKHFPASRRDGVGICYLTGQKMIGSEKMPCFEARFSKKEIPDECEADERVQCADEAACQSVSAQ
jgi:hypothetical protein